MAVCSFAHCEAALSLQAAYSDYQIGAFENFHQPVEDTLMVLRPGPKVVFQYELRFGNRLKSQLLISHLFLPIKQMPSREKEETRNQAAVGKYPHFLELSDQFLFQCEKPSAHYAYVLFSSTPEYIPLDFHSVSPALRAGRMDRPGRPEGDNDIVEQYNNPSRELSLPRA